MRRGGAVLLVAIAATLAVIPGAAAAPRWLPPERLATGSLSVIQPRVAFDRLGNAVVVWEDHAARGNLVRAAVRLVFEGRWRPAQTISDARELAFRPDVAMDGAGNAVVVWSGFGDGDERVRAAVRAAATGRWLRPVTLSGAGVEAGEPELAVSPGWLAIVAWWATGNQQASVEARVARTSSGTWGPVEDVSGRGGAAWPSLAVDGAGNALAVWSESTGSSSLVRARTRSAGGGWSQVQTLSGVRDVPAAPEVGSSRSGESVVVWSDTEDGSLGVVRATSRSSASAAWAEPVDISAGDPQNSSPRVVLDAAGNALAIWHRWLGEESAVLESAARPAGGARWSAPTAVARTNGFFDPAEIGAGPPGTALVVWAGLDAPRETGDLILRARRGSTLTGAWDDAVQTLSAPDADAYGPHVGFDAAGNALAVWGQHMDARFLPTAAAYDAAGPVFAALTLPRRPRVGTRLRFSVRARDAWSPAAGPPRWSFGDGSRAAAGTQVTHFYRAPGSYAVTVTQADTLGNVTSRSARITVLRQGR